MNGLDLFSGIGGISIALKPWVRTVAYCESDRYAQAVLLSRMRDRQLDRAPIWNDVRTLKGSMLPGIDIVFGGFPCQDISIAGHGKGLEGERSGLVFDLLRLIGECKPRFVFLENVPAFTVRGLDRVLLELDALGYDARWTVVSAAEMGAPHLRERFWLLASDSDRHGIRNESRRRRRARGPEGENGPKLHGEEKSLAYSSSGGWGQGSDTLPLSRDANLSREWWESEPDVDRVVNGLPHRVDRIRCLGNSVVPLAAREAFQRLAGLQEGSIR